MTFTQGGLGGVKNSYFSWKSGEEWIHYIGSCESTVIPSTQGESWQVSKTSLM